MEPQLYQICYLIDDDADEQDIFQEALTSLNNGIELIYGSDSRDAVKKLKRGNFVPDYIFIDVNMPSLNGWELLQEINKLNYLNHVPKVIYSTSSGLAEKSAQYGASGYIQKQSTVSALETKLHKFFEEHRHQP